MKIEKLKHVYIGFMMSLVMLTIFTPLLIRDGISLVGEETLESIAIAAIFIVGFLVNRFYEKELKSREQYLQEAWKHIGEVNLLADLFKDSVSMVDRYPENKKELRELLASMAEKILGAVNSPFVMLRILLPDEIRMVSEYFQARNDDGKFDVKISNKQLMENAYGDKYLVVTSSASNAKIKAYCILSKIKINSEQEIFIQKMVDELTMLFTIFLVGTVHKK